MIRKDQYQLLDFGEGRKLERFGKLILDRPCKTADGARRTKPAIWDKADAVFVRDETAGGNWRSQNRVPLSWTIAHKKLVFELKLTDFGHVGIFPEQVVNWDWIRRQIKAINEPVRVLNLFAYTGGCTLVSAAVGAEVVHVDAAQNTVLWARRNTEASGLKGSPIRWITEDATRFLQREMKRGNTYHAVILDPPTFGHGPKGEIWKIEQHLPELLEHCMEITDEHRRFMLLSCHSTGIYPQEIQKYLTDALGDLRGGKVESGGLAIPCADGRQLYCGVATRWALKKA